MQQNQKLSLKDKVSQILCQKHREPIVSLNIGPNVLLGERLLCLRCPSIGSQVAFIDQVEDHFAQWSAQEQEDIQKEIDNFEQLNSLIRQTLDELQITFSKLIKSVNAQLQIHSDNFNKLIEPKSKFNQIVSNLQLETLSAPILQDAALYLSEQNVLKGELQRKEKFELPIEYKKSIDESLKKLQIQLNHFRDALQQKPKQSEPTLKQEQLQVDLNNQKYKGPIQLDGHNDTIFAVAISNDEKLMASGGQDKKIILWNLEEKTIKFKFDGGAIILDLAFSEDNKWLAAAQFGIPYNVLIFEIKDLKANPSITLEGHSDSIRRIVFTKNSEFLVSGSSDKTLKIWDIQKSGCIVTKELSNWVYGISISQNEKFISAGCDGGYAYLFDSSKIKEIEELTQWKADDPYVYCTIFTPDSKNVLTICEEIKFWSIEQLLSKNQQKTPLKIIKSNGEIWSLCWRMNGSILISNDGEIKIWNVATGDLIKSLEVPGGYQAFSDKNFAVTSNLQCIITGGDNAKLKVYELE